jgi:hypothetical protein
VERKTSPPWPICSTSAALSRSSVDARRVAPEGDDPEGRRGHQLQLGGRFDPALRVLYEIEAGVDGRAEGAEAEGVHGDPELQCPARPCELEAAVREVHFLLGRVHVVEVVG